MRTDAELLAWLQQFKKEPAGQDGTAAAAPKAPTSKAPAEVPPGMWWCDYCHAVIEWGWAPDVEPDFRCSAYITDLREGGVRCTGALYQAPKLPSARRLVALVAPLVDGLLDLCPGAGCFRRERVAKSPWQAPALPEDEPYVGETWHCRRCERTWESLVPPYRNPSGARCPCCAGELVALRAKVEEPDDGRRRVHHGRPKTGDEVGIAPYQEHAIAVATVARRDELAPLRLEVSQAIDAIGWRKARPIVESVLCLHASGPRGGWWAAVGKRAGAKLLSALAEAKESPRQDPFASITEEIPEDKEEIVCLN